jgi:hypothetical protein
MNQHIGNLTLACLFMVDDRNVWGMWRPINVASIHRELPAAMEAAEGSLFVLRILLQGSHQRLGVEWLTRFAWWRQDLHAIELLRAHIGEWTITRMLDYWRVMCFTGYRLNWNSWIWIPFPVDSECTLLCAQVDITRYSSIASGNNCIVRLCKCVSLHL